MFRLQSSPPQPGPSIIVLVVLVIVGAIIGSLGSAIVQRLSNPVGKYRFLYAGVLIPYTLLAYGVLALLGFGPALARMLPVDASGLFGTALGGFTEFLAAGIVWLAIYAPTVRGVSEVRDLGLKTTQSIVRTARYVVGLSIILVLVVTPLRVTPGEVSLFVVAIVLAILGAIFIFGAPWILPILRSTSHPTSDIADRITTLRAESGLDIKDVMILNTDEEETASTYVRGPPGYRRLFITSTFLERFDDDTATALLAIQTGQLRFHMLEIRASTALVSGLVLIASLTGVGPRWPVLGLSLGTLAVGFWLSRRGVRAADDYAAERVGASAVVTALERYAEVHALEPSRRRIPNPLSVNVALGDRIDRLSGWTDPS